MQSQILTTHPQARLRVYAIWVNKQAGDACSRWDAAGLTDPWVVLAQAIVAEGPARSAPHTAQQLEQLAVATGTGESSHPA